MKGPLRTLNLKNQCVIMSHYAALFASKTTVCKVLNKKHLYFNSLASQVDPARRR